ncbi:MAG: hypothetical protein RMZ41_007555 [Nostoc sp. DedVER02]|uniref:hypothetical protein n=1 Tax=unclassified Nostoc TaxID=2593658 RepID=UPI002AD34A5D|nr:MULTISPECIES: hypothetical protein [unclassified Nostoc]MDZ7985440.1 hypothetical protein [Nostoc sp. DedVER02]MDZ8116906.1 hypothetical protein [Nostoc sp. DedVER01b]
MPYLRLQILLLILPLLLVGIIFWTGSDLLTKQLLGFSYRTLDKLQADTLPQVELKLNFTVVDMKIDQEPKFTQVKIKTANSLLKRLELEIPNSRFPELAIAQKFGLYPQQENLELNKQMQVNIPVTLKAIKAEIQKEQGLSFIEVRTANNTLRKLDFVLPVTEINMVETMTAKLLNLSPKEVKKLIRYQVRNQSLFKSQPKQRIQTRKAAKTEIISNTN